LATKPNDAGGKSGTSVGTGRFVGIDDVRFDENGLIPAVVQDVRSHQVLMVAYMNRESLAKTLETGLTWFYSRSRGRLWQKGESSGHVQRVRAIMADCDQDTLLISVVQEGAGACHEGYVSCFHYPLEEPESGRTPVAEVGRAFDPEVVYGRKGQGASTSSPTETIDALYAVISGRKSKPVKGSYTSYLFESGIDKILKKVGEECTEVLIAGKGGDNDSLIMESADLMYHLLVLMVEAGVRPDDVWAELAKRRGGGGSEDAPPGK